VNRYNLDVSFSSQNCNSLNVSTSVRNQAAKIVSILDLNTDVIFLSDTRLNGRHKSIIDAFRLRYRMIHHSSLNRRGVAVLIRNDLDLQVQEEFRDTQENALLLRVVLRGMDMIIGSVYGPNTNEFAMFDFLQDCLNRWRNLPIVLGGDWNATLSNLPLDTNPDVFSMRAVPSTARTERILQICEDFGLTDPYRTLHPADRDYTYIPSGVLRTNRSRIDFFLLSDTIFENVQKCEIAQSFCRKSFDHKNIVLCFKKSKKKVGSVLTMLLLKTPSWNVL
jgi:exonuclease III